MPAPPRPSPSRSAATDVVRRLREHGHAAYFAGGCVRDELLGLNPTDFDVATDATPARITALFPRASEVGASFGVVIVRSARVSVEVATFRSDGPYTDRRRPDAVSFSDARTDAHRRDFTVNALFLDPLAPDDSPQRVVDYVGGMDDLRDGLLRAVGDPAARLAEDHLRALRAARLAGRLNFRIHSPTAAAIRDHAGELTGVSRERIGEELRKIMRDPARARAVALLQDLRLDAPILQVQHAAPPLPTLTGLPPAAPFAACLAAWALDRKPVSDAREARDLPLRWRVSLMLSNEEAGMLAAILKDIATFRADWANLPVARRKRAAATEWFPDSLSVLQSCDRSLFAIVHADVQALSASPTGLHPTPLVTGDDLVRIGLTPGPAFKTILDALYDAQLEDRLVDARSALGRARAMADELATRLREPGTPGGV